MGCLACIIGIVLLFLVAAIYSGDGELVLFVVLFFIVTPIGLFGLGFLSPLIINSLEKKDWGTTGILLAILGVGMLIAVGVMIVMSDHGWI